MVAPSPRQVARPARREARKHPVGLTQRFADVDRALVMGIVNVTPDSFSDGGAYASPSAAIEHGLALLAQGADILDVGGESTRPGAARVGADEEWRRIGPVVAGLAAAGAVVSVDTMWKATALRAVDCGATIVNDVSGGLADPEMVPFIAGCDATYVVMHWRGHSTVMDQLALYDDVVADVRDELGERLAVLARAGVAADRVVLDPGLGFAKDTEMSWRVLAHLEVLVDMGYPVLVGASRKRFLADVTPPGAAAHERDLATAVSSFWAALKGAWCVRVHDVAGAATAVRFDSRLSEV